MNRKMQTNWLNMLSGAVMLVALVAVGPAFAADRYLDTSASVGLQGSTGPKWTNAIWSVDMGGTNLTNIASNDNVFVQVDTSKSLGTLSIPAVPAGTQYYVNDFTVGNTNSVTIGGQNFGFNIAGNITVQEQSKLSWDGSGVFAFKPKTTTVLTIQGSSTNVYNAGASAKTYTMGSLIFGDGNNRLAFSADQNLTFSNISGGSSNVIDLGSNSAAGLTINNAGDCAFDGEIRNAGDVTKTGSGTLVLGGPNTFSGDTTVSAGTLVLSNKLALQNSRLVVDAKVLFGAGITEFTLGGLGWSGADLGLTNQTGDAITLKVGNNSAATTWNQNLKASGKLVKVGSGTLTMSNNNDYKGDTQILEGTLLFSGGSGRLGGGTYNGAISNDASMVWSNTVAQTLGGTISGSGSLTKANSSTLTLTGTNVYSGATAVYGGTLKVSNAGSLSTNTALTVVGTNSVVNLNGKAQSCVSVGGTGFVTNGTLTVTSALYPGGSNSVGTLTLGNLTLATGSKVYWDYDGGSGDTNKVLGTASLPSSATVQVNASGTLPSRAVLFDCRSIEEAPGGVAGWTVTGALPNSFVKVEGSQLLLIIPKGTMISFH
jgi:autotransporter-associated beta strand protein